MKRWKRWVVVTVTLALVTGGAVQAFAQTEENEGMPSVVSFPESGPYPVDERVDRVPDGSDWIEEGVTPKMSRERAVELAGNALKNYMNTDVTSDDYQLNTEYRRDWQQPDQYVWSLHWSLSEPARYSHAGVTLDAATGQILDMNQESGTHGEPSRSFLAYTREDARDIADAMIDSLMPGKRDQLRLQDDQGTMTPMHYGGAAPYHFYYVREINGIVYDANFVNVSIDGSNGNVRWFSQRWEESPTLPDRAGMIDSEMAEERFRDLMNLELIYLPVRNQFSYEAIARNHRLVYRMAPSSANMLDAKTGKPLDWSGNEAETDWMEKDISSAEKAAIARSAEPVTVRETPMEQSEAESLALAYAGRWLEEDITIQGSYYMEGDDNWEALGRKVWNVDFSVEPRQKNEATGDAGPAISLYSGGRVLVNAMTGELVSYNWWQHDMGAHNEEELEHLSWEEGYDRAIEAIKMHHPGRIAQIRTSQRVMERPAAPEMAYRGPVEYHYHFPRLVEGVLFEDNSLSVGIDGRSGRVMMYADRWSETLSLPRPIPVVEEIQAMDSLLNGFRMEPAYNRFTTSWAGSVPEYETKLVYRWLPVDAAANYPFVDAISGVMLDYNGNPQPGRDMQGFESRIGGHWVERTARLLAQQGIIDTVTFRPDEPITRMETLKMMVAARGMNYYGYMMEGKGDSVQFVDPSEPDEDQRILQWALRHGFIDQLPDESERRETINREEAAMFMVRFMGYRTLSEAVDIFTVPYSDESVISRDALGAVAISRGLGVISNDGRPFRPKDETTMAEMAEMLFRAVAHQR